MSLSQKSVLDRSWVYTLKDDRLCQTIAQRFHVPHLIAEIIAARGIDLDDIESYLDPTLKSLLPDPYLFKDMEKATHICFDAIETKKPIAIFGDYDVDGATSTALLTRFLSSIGVKSSFYIPDRLAEGYGPNAAAFEALYQEGHRLLITLDCGTASYEPIEHAKKLGFDVIVLDHHAAQAHLPIADALVNPNRLDEEPGYGHLCAVGVTFLFIVALNRLLRQKGFYQDKTEPNLLQWLDLVALGTVCDVVPLTGLNRAYVAQGLKIMAKRQNLGLKAIADRAGLTAAPDVYQLGYMIGPRINASGRVGTSSLGTEILSTQDPLRAAQIADQLEQFNTERKNIEAEVLIQAEHYLAETDQLECPLMIAIGKDWHPGVVGIVASRLKEKYYRPVCVISLNNGVGKASGRSVKGIDLGALIISALSQGMLVNGGGHKMAVGFSVLEENIPQLQAFLLDHLKDHEIIKLYDVDANLSPASITFELAEWLNQLSPYGTAHHEPRFVLQNARILSTYPVGDQHLRCVVTDGSQSVRLKAMAFRSMQNGLGEALIAAANKPSIQLAGQIKFDLYGGKSDVQFFIEDALL